MQPRGSLAESLASLPPSERAKRLREIAPSEEDLAALEYAWDFWARPKQLPPPGLWFCWLVLAGRGFGKTRTGAEWVRHRIEKCNKHRLALVGRTAADARDVIVEGESGILATAPPWFKPHYEPSKRRLTWPNGAIATTYGADEPDTLRGPQHDDAWADELAAWRYPDAWDQLIFGLRLGDDPRVVVTTTPRPTKIIRALVDDPTTIVTRGATTENAGNLAKAFLRKLKAKYEGTRLGRQELLAEILDDAPGALWNRDEIDDHRVLVVPAMRRIVIAIDPAASSQEGSDETGMIVDGIGEDGHGYVLEDASGRYTPAQWGAKAVDLFVKWEADCIVGEVNNGGEMVGHTVQTAASHKKVTVAYKAIHASRGKQTRAEPVAALYEQGRVHHVGSLPELEDQQCTWEPGTGQKSPDRMDANVYGLTELEISEPESPGTQLLRIRPR